MSAVTKQEAEVGQDSLTILTCHKNLYLTKIYNSEGMKGYDEAAAFAVSTVTVRGIKALSAELGKLVTAPHKCIIRGAFVGEARAVELLPPKRPGMFARRMALFPDVPHHWIQLDIDKYKVDGYDPVAEPVRACDEYIGRCLPACFHGVSYHWMLTSSAGSVAGVLKARLTFWLEKSYGSEHLKAWAETEGIAVDKSLFHQIQVHYTAAPLFREGAVDPVPVRWGFEDGMLGDEVALEIDPLCVLKPDAVVKGLNKDMPDACAKPGWIGAFCRAFPVADLVDGELCEVFAWQNEGGERRLNFLLGSGAAGGAFATPDGYHIVNKHDSDPFGNRAANSFDLVRWYKFGHLDSEAQAKDLITSRPSYKAMVAWARELEPVKSAAVGEVDATVEGMFEDLGEESEEPAPVRDWRLQIEHNDRMEIIVNRHNIALCVLNLFPKLRWNEFAIRLEHEGDLPWRKNPSGSWEGDADINAMLLWLERWRNWAGNISLDMLMQILTTLEHERCYHPVRDWIKGLKWDGVGRLDTLLVRCAGAEDSAYTRETTRKWITAAVKRIMEPGCKFDYVLTLVGDQGIRKSSFFAALGGKWFADDAPSMAAGDGKAFKEYLAGKWILELAELSASKRADEDHVKSVITSQIDSYRPAYGRSIRNVPRQCVLGATTNNDTPYRDRTGGRRNWPNKITQTIDVDLVLSERDQVFAEAKALWEAGEELFLSPETEAEARVIQEEFTNDSGVGEAAAVIAAWLDGGTDEFGEVTPALNQISAIEIAETCTGLKSFNNWSDKRALAREAMKLIEKGGAWEKYPHATHTKSHGKQKVWKRKGTWSHREKQ